MEVGALRERIEATLQPQADVRLQAELDLKYVSLTGYGTRLLWIHRSADLVLTSRQKSNLVS